MDQPTQARARWRAGYPRPPARRFRVYAFDPLASTLASTAGINNAVLSLPWEEPWETPLNAGPSGEYLEVVDFDAPAGVFYAPVDPNDPQLLAQDGLPPSEGRPQFHQQMVYAVAMQTIHNFERALGRKVLWSDRPHKTGDDADAGFVRQLRVYPHALAEANAYYSPQKKALLFGYFQAQDGAGLGVLPGGWVFTCLSHDVVAHETTHAILDGIHHRYVEPSNPDSLAFHEAFADTVALLQHFTMPEVVRNQLNAARGDLRSRTLLSGLARQFGEATGRGGPLREAIDAARTGPAPVVGAYKSETADPHLRGAFLVAAIFDAFLAIYDRRTADLWRLARDTAISAGGPGGEAAQLNPDLVERLSREAAKVAGHVLRMCVRALDYAPAVDLHFGEYLRAIVTADADLVPDDPFFYRESFVEAFSRRGIWPSGCMSMAPDSLLWDGPDAREQSLSDCQLTTVVEDLDTRPYFERLKIWRMANANQAAFWRWLNQDATNKEAWERMLGVKLLDTSLKTVHVSDRTKRPAVEVHSVRTTRRGGPDGQDLRQLVIEIAQTRRGFLDPAVQAAQDAGTGEPLDGDFKFRGGATLIVDLRDGLIRYAIRKSIDDDARLQAQRDFIKGAAESDKFAVYFGAGAGQEPFAMLHRNT